MPIFLTDTEVARLVGERKILPPDYMERLQVRPKRGHFGAELDVAGDTGADFRIILRQSRENHLDFSVILAYRPPNTNQTFRLRRYNGKHRHTNRLEGNTIDGFHMHIATERYQQLGTREDAFAKACDQYQNFHGAIECLLKECAFEAPPGTQLPLLEGGL
jgi:hypothetical protein